MFASRTKSPSVLTRLRRCSESLTGQRSRRASGSHYTDASDGGALLPNSDEHEKNFYTDVIANYHSGIASQDADVIAKLFYSGITNQHPTGDGD